MIEILRRNIVGVFILFFVTIMGVIFFLTTEMVTMTGTVIEHNVVADKYGTAHYYTLVDYGDEIKSEQGIEFYVVPIGRKVTTTERRFK